MWFDSLHKLGCCGPETNNISSIVISVLALDSLCMLCTVWLLMQW